VRAVLRTANCFELSFAQQNLDIGGTASNITDKNHQRGAYFSLQFSF